MVITANEVKIRGKDRYVVSDIERYNAFRKNALDLVCFKAMEDIKNGKSKVQSADEHIAEIS